MQIIQKQFKIYFVHEKNINAKCTFLILYVPVCGLSLLKAKIATSSTDIIKQPDTFSYINMVTHLQL